MEHKINLAIIDDEVLFSDGLSHILSANPQFKVTHIATDGSDFLTQLKAASELPDIALIDVRMSPMDGFETVKRLSEEFPSIKPIILSSYYEEAFIGHMIKLGVAAFLPKNSTKDALYQAINQVHKSGVYFTEKDHEMLRLHIQQKSAGAFFKTTDQLSKRELEILKLICSELTNQEIADKLFISKRTVESHRERILEKLGVRNTVGIVIYAITQQLYAPESHYYF